MAKNLPKEQRIAKRARAWSLRQKGWSECRIAEDLGVHQSTVSRWLDHLSRRAMDRLDARITRDYLASLGLLDHAVDEALQAWERSKKPRRKASKKSGPAAGGASPGSSDQTTVETTEREGDPAFWHLALDASERRARLLGFLERFGPKPAEEHAAAGSVADAVLEALRRDADYRPDTDPEPTADATA